MQDVTVDAFITLQSIKLGITPTEEQREMIKHFDDSFISFASPGTGKTATAVSGLLTAELYYKIKGENIYALSFTRMATNELAVRHEIACEKLGIKQHVNFKTLHSLCTSVLEKNYKKLGMDSFKTARTFPIEDMAKMLEESARDWDIKLNPYKVRALVRAIRTLNSSLVFDKEHVESKMVFKDTDLNYEDFTKLRKLLYDYNKLVEIIQVDDILLYTLELLTRHPEVSEEFKAQCKLMLVDESQDLSLLQLRLISLLSDKAILIGDIKQQIYAFNGACQEVKEQYYKFYPEAKTLNLTQSFRCCNEIADYATPLILPNKVGGEDFKGKGPGGKVVFDDSLDIAQLCDQIEADFRNNNNTFPDSILFLFRNNYSVVPIAEELFKRRVPFRVNKYDGAHRVPVVQELCELIELANNPTTLSNIAALPYIIPEFRGYRSYHDIPLFKIAQELGCSVFDVNYSFREEHVGGKAMEALMEVREGILKGYTVAELINLLWTVFSRAYLKDKERLLEFPSKYYTNLVGSIVRNKTYTQFGNDELKKSEFIKDNIERRLGVRCYTSHAAKGLEADIVHFVDADEGVVPNVNKVDEMRKKHCEVDAAREIRNERSLVYVAATRAKRELHIHYNKLSGLASLFTTENKFMHLDKLYQEQSVEYEDVTAFCEFIDRRLF